jgi:hypothetical protein
MNRFRHKFRLLFVVAVFVDVHISLQLVARDISDQVRETDQPDATDLTGTF